MDLLELNVCNKADLAKIDKICMHMPWTEEMFENELSNESTRYIGAFVGDTLAGYGGMWLVLDEAQITNIAVLPQFRRQGIGKAILASLEAFAKGASIMMLEVRESNESAIRLYEKNGFTADGIRKNYYKSPTENAVLMSKKLNVKSE